MQQEVAGLYEIEEKIGEGGGGIVYLGQHIRLKKSIVLKADKRKLNAGEATLRREVDLLKNLSQTYIPQVYDYVEEGDTVYTVMDYIEGESLDKRIARGALPSQAELVQWACQLLEALVYLHSCPPHGILHGDIKPANIMQRPNGDICLIDFNIALALGEDGAVKVGFSRGYASPEHYGADYIRENRAAAIGSESITADLKKRRGKKRSQGQLGTKVQAQSETVVIDENRAGSATERLNEADAVRTEIIDAAETETNNAAETEIIHAAGTKIIHIAETGTGNAAWLASEAGKHSEFQTAQKNSGVSSSPNSTGGRKRLLLDARSDIYCLGATLYHLISGKCPESDARNVVPLGSEICSPAISAILQKAMAPHPQDRYQSAQEMLEAFCLLHKTDPRAVKHRRRMFTSAAVLAGIFLLGGAATLLGMRQMEQRQHALVLAEYSANALSQGNVTEAVEKALEAIPHEKNIWNAPVTAQAQKALADALGVYDLFAGFTVLDNLPLPSAPFDFSISPQGSRMAVVYAYETAVFDLESGKKCAAFPIKTSALSDCLFLDESRIVYAGKDGVCAYDVDLGKTLWTAEEANILSVSADKKIVAAINGTAEYAIFYDSATGGKIAERSFEGLHLSIPVNDIFADAKNYIFSLNMDGSMLAISFDNGSLYILDQNTPDNDLTLCKESDYTRFCGGFCGKYFAFTAEKSNEMQFELVDVQKAAYVADFSSKDKILLQVDEAGIYLVNLGLLVQMDPDSLQEIQLAHTEGAKITAFYVGEEYALVATENQDYAFYDRGANKISGGSLTENAEFALLAPNYALLANRNEASVRLLKLENHEQAQFLTYDARYPHDEARVSADRSQVMLFSYQGFRIYDMQGNLVAETSLPDAKSIYDQQFRRTKDGSYLEVIWYDGMRRCYNATDGTLITEESGEAPDKDLYEEFHTKDYRVESSLHTAPKVYGRSSGKLLKSLESDDYLTYVTQTGEYLVTEYIATSGERYGLLLDRNLETVAYLPGLCDVLGEDMSETVFVFDCEGGNLRQCRLYSLQELIALGESYKKQ